MTLVVIDTSTTRLILAVRHSNGTTRFFNLPSGGNHARDILPRLQELLDGARADRIGVAMGPGSFTGLRIGLSTAKGLAEGWDVPLFGLDSLSAMADTWQNLYRRPDTAVLSVIDARKKCFYGMLRHGSTEVLDVRDWSPESWKQGLLQHWDGPLAISGFQGALLAAAWGELPAKWEVAPVLDWSPALLAQLERAEAASAMAPENGPRYIRLSEAEENLLARQSPTSFPIPTD